MIRCTGARFTDPDQRSARHHPDPREDVDSVGRSADLEDRSGPRQVVDGELAERGAEDRQGFPSTERIGRIRIDPEANILRVARLRVKGECVSSNHEVAHVTGVELGQQISEVEVDRHVRPSRLRLPGPCPRARLRAHRESCASRMRRRPSAHPHRAGRCGRSSRVSARDRSRGTGYAFTPMDARPTHDGSRRRKAAPKSGVWVFAPVRQ